MKKLQVNTPEDKTEGNKMNTQYVPLENMRRAISRANSSWNTFTRLCAVSAHYSMGWAHRWIPTEESKRTI